MSVSRVVLGLLPFLLVAGIVAAFAWPEPPRTFDAPWAFMPSRPPHVDHAAILNGPFPDGPSVTRACLKCHEQSAHDFMKTSHWTWVGHEVTVPGHAEPMRIGKKNLINNFCIGIQSNWPRCTSCHAGYGWEDDSFDFKDMSRVDCLVCHDQSGGYLKGAADAGNPAEGVDLLAAARSVGHPTRENCGVCHFQGGGGDAVKHGDLDGSMYHPSPRIDAHMGGKNFVCQDCHRTDTHDIPGRSMAVSVDDTNRVRCIDCHSSRPHGNERIDSHTGSVACQTCHIPHMAVDTATKMSWDWSTAGQDNVKAPPKTYNKKKGTFTFGRGVVPEYYWYDGTATRYIQGDKIDPDKTVRVNAPRGDIVPANPANSANPKAKIWPFKVHRGKQIYDTKHRYLLVPKTFGKGGYWSDFDWDKAARLGAEATGLPYSGGYDFVKTEMYWPLSHMVATKDKALQCTDCHGENGRMDWKALGYTGDPVLHGGRR
jgi:octaheme c-type cytochrome (tetrathionate reductase family)